MWALDSVIIIKQKAAWNTRRVYILVGYCVLCESLGPIIITQEGFRTDCRPARGFSVVELCFCVPILLFSPCCSTFILFYFILLSYYVSAAAWRIKALLIVQHSCRAYRQATVHIRVPYFWGCMLYRWKTCGCLPSCRLGWYHAIYVGVPHFAPVQLKIENELKFPLKWNKAEIK